MPPPARHPKYYYPDGSITFLLPRSNILYKLLRSQLAQQSDHFSTLFSLKPVDPGEGMSDTNPIVLQEVTASDFDHICAFITGQFDDTVEGLAALLNLGTFLQMSRPRNYALQQLNALPSWSPFLKLHLGIHNQISEWTHDAFYHIVLKVPLEEITLDDMLCIGGPAYWAVNRAKSRILEHRRLLAFDWPEATHSPKCSLSTSCGITWKSEWWYTFAKCILHPDNKYSPAEALKEVELTYTQYMTQECKALTIQAVKDDGGLDQSVEIIEEALGSSGFIKTVCLRDQDLESGVVWEISHTLFRHNKWSSNHQLGGRTIKNTVYSKTIEVECYTEHSDVFAGLSDRQIQWRRGWEPAFTSGPNAVTSGRERKALNKRLSRAVARTCHHLPTDQRLSVSPPFMSTLPVLFREKQRPAEIWFMIWRELGTLIDKDFKEVNGRRRMNDQGAPFYGAAHDVLRKDPRRRKAKLAFASAYSIALQEYGPELYEHAVLTTCGAVDAILDCARTSMLLPIQPSSLRATWILHIDLILSDLECMKLDWGATREAWSAFIHLETLTLCYYPKEPAPLNQFRPIAAHLPPSLQLLRLRPWGEANDIPPQFPQILEGGAKGRILGLRQDFWWDVAWAKDLQAFQNVPQIHLQAVVYVVWPPYSKQAAEKAFRGWTSRVNGGRLRNISVTLFLPNEGLDVQEAVKELDGDTLTDGKRYGYFPHDAEDVEDALPNILAYNWRKDSDGNWEVDMDGATARRWARDYGHFSYPIAAELDYRLKWGWYSSME